MIDTHGNYQMLTEYRLPDYAPEGSLLVFGAEEDVKEMATKVRLGFQEQDKRRQRRKQQRSSRKRNR